MNSRWVTRQLPILTVLLIAFVLNATGVNWGLPVDRKGWAFDELTPVHARGGARRGFADGWVANYPPLHYRLLHYTGEGVRRLAGDGWQDLSRKERDTRQRRAGRYLSVFMATLLIWGLYRCVRLYAGRVEACLAAAIAAGCLPFVFYAKTANVDVPYLFWFVASLFFLGQTMRHGRWRDHILLAVTATAAVATKDQAIALYAPVPVVILAASYRRTDASRPKWQRAARTLVDPLVLVSLGAALASFGALVNLIDNWDGFSAHLRRISTVSTSRFDLYAPTFAGHLAMGWQSVKHLAFAMSWPLLITALAGVGLALRRPRRWIPLVFLFCAVGYYLGFVSVIRHNYVRFLLPISVVLAPFAAAALTSLLRRRRGRLWAMALSVTLLLFGFARAAALDRFMARDSRYSAETWLAAEAPEAKVAGVGRPQMLPRGLVNIPWRRLERHGIGLLTQREFDYVLFSRSGIWGSSETALSERLLASGSGFEKERCFTASPPWPMPSTDGIFTNLNKLSPEVCVLRRSNDA